MNLARARELGNKQLEPAFRGVTHYSTPQRLALKSEEALGSSDQQATQATSSAPACVDSSTPTTPPVRGAESESLCAGGGAVPVTLPRLLNDNLSFALDLAHWQAQLADVVWPRPLCQLRLPGTHDSGAYALSRRHFAPSRLPRWMLRLNRKAWWLTRPFAGLVARWGEAQRLDVHAQLCHGARYLDIRVVNVERVFHVAHGLLGATCDDVFAQVGAFLDTHPGELVVVDCNHFHHFGGKDDHLAFIALIQAHLQRYLPRNDGSKLDAKSAFGALIDAGVRCIVLYGGADFLGVASAAVAAGCWLRTERSIVSPWPRAGNLTDLRARLSVLDSASARAPGLFVLQCVVTPNARLVRRGLVRRPSSLRQLASGVTPEVVRGIVGGSLKANCIVMLDHIELGDIAQLILNAYVPHLATHADGTPPAETDAEEIVGVEDVVFNDDDGEQWLDGAESLTNDSPLLLKLSSMLETSQLTEAMSASQQE